MQTYAAYFPVTHCFYIRAYADLRCKQQKLRKQNSLVRSMTIFASSSPHDSQSYYRKSVFHHFIIPTADPRLIMAACTEAVESLFRKGVRFYRCGVGLLDLCDANSYQHDLFSQTQDNTQLMQIIDSINQKYGRGAVHLAGKGTEPKFTMRREFLSPQYLTRWSDLPRLHCI
jgi:DNA polymerase V